MAARARGVQFGRKAKERPNEYKELKSLYGRQKISSRDAAKKLGICHTTFLKWVKEDQELPGKKTRFILRVFVASRSKYPYNKNYLIRQKEV